MGRFYPYKCMLLRDEKGRFIKGSPPPKTAFKKGHIPYYKGKKIPQNSNENNYLWKGENASYIAKHAWVYRHKGKAYKCEFCGKEGIGREINWANIDHKYKRNLDDYISLCRLCHEKYDKEHNFTCRTNS